MLISGESARHELTHLKSALFAKNLNIAFGAERVNMSMDQ